MNIIEAHITSSDSLGRIRRVSMRISRAVQQHYRVGGYRMIVSVPYLTKYALLRIVSSN